MMILRKFVLVLCEFSSQEYYLALCRESCDVKPLCQDRRNFCLFREGSSGERELVAHLDASLDAVRDWSEHLVAALARAQDNLKALCIFSLTHNVQVL